MAKKWKYEGLGKETPGSISSYNWHKGDMRMLIGDLAQEGEEGWNIEVTTDGGELLLAKTVPTKKEAFAIGTKFRKKN